MKRSPFQLAVAGLPLSASLRSRCVLSLLAVTALAGCASVGRPNLQATLTRTSYGVPHIQADSDAGIGYGLGYSVAEDRLCDAMDSIVTANGERSRFFGPDKTTPYGLNNLRSDFYEKWLNDDTAAKAYLAAQPQSVRDMLRGYAAGFNRFLRDKGTSARQDACKDASWVRKISALDLARLSRHYTVTLGIGDSASVNALIAAAPPKPVAAAQPSDDRATTQLAFASDAADRSTLDPERNSNAAAFGRATSANGSGLLWGNPHLPNFGDSRLSMIHVTRPGHYDVLGSAMVGLPFPTVGFNRRVAYTGTISQSQHLSYFALQLAPGNPRAYLVDGKAEAMKERVLSVQVLGSDGKLATQQHTLYETRYGPVFAAAGPYAWTHQRAFAIRDANADNPYLIAQLESYARSNSVDQLHQGQLPLLGNAWLQITAADDKGDVYFGNLTSVPRITDAMLETCVSAEFKPLLVAMGTYPFNSAAVAVLDGSRSACNWSDSADAPRKGIFAGNEQPHVVRGDFVQNSNDSSWYTNPDALLTGFAKVVSREDVPVWWRASMGLKQFGARLNGTDGRPGNKMDPETLWKIFYDFRVLSAELHLDAILGICTPSLSDARVSAADLQQACQLLRAWDRTANLDSKGYLIFERLWLSMVMDNSLFTAFDPKHPLRTDARLRMDDSAVRARVTDLLVLAVKSMRDGGIALDTTLADIQFFASGGKPIAWPGGPENTGIYNKVQAAPVKSGKPGQRHVVAGASHIQAVTFDAKGPINYSLLPISQATDPARAPHLDDQAELFAQKRWVRFPFSAAEIAADPTRTTLELRE